MAKNKYRLGLYEKAMPNNLTWLEKFTYCKEFGFDYLEISVDETDSKLARLDNEERFEIKEAMEKTGMTIGSMCLSGHRKYPLGSLNDDTVARSLDIMEKAVDLAYFLGVRIIQLAGYDVYYDEGSDETRKRFLINLKTCVEMASRKGILLGFETMETAFMDTVKKSMAIVDEINNPYLQIYPDMGNLTNASILYGHDLIEDIERGTGHIIAAHLKETIVGHYREIPFGTGHTDFEAVLQCLKKMGVTMFVGEFWYVGQDNWQDDCKFASRFLREYCDKVFA